MLHSPSRLRRGSPESSFVRALLATALAVGSLTACGGTATDGSRGGIGGSGGESSDGGPGGSGSGGKGSGGEGPGGATSVGGGGGVGGFACPCLAIECGPGFHTVSVPGQCCPSCQACTAKCVSALPCPVGEVPVTLPGQCCPTSCGPPPAVDAGLACPLAASPTCLGNVWPQCEPDWAAALSTISTCDPPPVGGGEYLANCGPYHAIVAQGVDTTTRFFYDASGMLVGQVNVGIVGTFCQAFDPSFVAPPSNCAWFPHCPQAMVDGGQSSCGNGVLDPGEACDGTNLNGATCASATMAARPHGVLKCSASCAIDVSGCTF